jgi:hypothetical protein
MKHSLRLLAALALLSLGSLAYAGDAAKDKKADPACGCGEKCQCTKDGKACACKGPKAEPKKDEKKKPE